MIVTKHARIAAGGTITLINHTIALKQLVIVVSSAGTTWIVRIQDAAAAPAIIVAPITVAAPSTITWIYQHFREPLPMDGGLSFVTASGTPGVLDIWFSFEQPATA